MSEEIIGVILAGGLARRLGHIDKAMVKVGQKTLLHHAIKILQPQCQQLIINANGNPNRFRHTNLPIVADTIEGHAGPLSGVLSGMEWARQNSPQTKWIGTLPVDTPFAPNDFILQLLTHTISNKSQISCAQSKGRHHPVVGLWPVHLAAELRAAMVDENIRKVDLWTSRYKLSKVDFKADGYDPFFNINTPKDVEAGEKLYKDCLNGS